MAYDSRLSLRRARHTGVVICVATLALAALFIAGVAQGSYWALALPVAVGVLGVLALAFWIGFTINTVQGIPAEADHYEGRQARRIALGICAASVALGAWFLLGVVRGSYWALAVPVSLAVLGLAAMVFWIGWAIVTQRTTLGEGTDGAAASADSTAPAVQPAADSPAPPREPPAADAP